MFHSNRNNRTFTGEIERIDPLLNGDVLTPSHLLFGTLLNSTIMRQAPNKIHYNEGDVINGSVFVREIPSGNHIRRAKFICQYCGNEFDARIGNIRFRNATSCGCYQKRMASETHRIHGLCNTSSYYRWRNLINRCYNEKVDRYPEYGGRGIKVCPEWKSNFKAFNDYIMSLPDSDVKGYQIDRIDTDGNYEPGNLRWANLNVQAANKRVSKRSKTGFSGIIIRGDKFRALIGVNNKDIRLGTFKTIEEALEARNNYIIDNNLVGYKIQEVC